MKGESRTRGPRKEEVEERIVASVCALSMTNVLHSWEHTLDGTNLLRRGCGWPQPREKDGCQVTIPTTRGKKRKKSDDPLAQDQLEEMIRAQMEEEEQVMSSLGDIYPRWRHSSHHLLSTPCYITCSDHASSIHIILTPLLSCSVACIHVIPFSGVELLYM